MKKMTFTTAGLTQSCKLLLASALSLTITACGGDSSVGYKPADSIDRAPYFSVSGSAVQDGSSIEASKLKKMPIEFFDDQGLKSYYVTINGEKVGEGEISGTSALVELDLDALEGNMTYSAKVLATDIANHSTVAHFTINVKAYYQFLRLLGSATPAGWDTSKAVAMDVDANNPAVFNWKGALTPGEFKISTQENVSWDSGYDWIHPVSTGQSLTATDYAVVVSGGADNKWVIPEGGAGIYSITVDQKAHKILIGKPLSSVFIVGSATPTGWNLSNATALERDAANVAKFNITIALGAGEFKFASQTESWEKGDWIYYGASSSLPTSPTSFDLRPAGGADNKWVVTGAEAGTYKITLDLDAGTIVAVKQ
jgi:hypothetical protein